MGAASGEQTRGVARGWILGLGVVAGLAACGPDEGDEPGPAPTETSPTGAGSASRVPFERRFDAAGRFIPDPRVPPAFAPVDDLVALKADEYDDVRAVHPERYAITAPSGRASLRPMVEWEPMRALAMAFPGYMLDSTNATATVVSIARLASAHGEVWIAVDGANAESGLKSELSAAGVSSSQFGTRIRFYRTALDAIWFIDSGPLPIIDSVDGSYAFADFRYYHKRPIDDGLPTVLSRALPTAFGRPSAVPTYRMPLTLEGGTFQATTEGVCLTGSRQIFHLSCYDRACDDSLLTASLEDLADNAYTQRMAATLAAYAGCKDLVVTHSITDDGTGHLDMYLKILDDDRILLGRYDADSLDADERDNAALLDDTARYLEAYVRPGGGHFQVLRLPMPGHRSAGGDSVPFTYINSTFFNGVNLWPATTFSSWNASRAEAQAVWDELLPGYENVWIDATELSFYSGAIHCITRTIPDLAEASWVGDGACSTETGRCEGQTDGYAGVCKPAPASGEVCWGPTWLCNCDDCASCPPGVPGGNCNGVEFQGCCSAGDVLFCDGTQLTRVPCGATGCGWNKAGGYYDCGESGREPTGEYPKTCPACTADCAGKACGDDGCGGSCGDCADGASCIAGACRTCASCEPGASGCDGDVAWRCEAGADGCNARPTADCAAAGEVCVDGACAMAPVEPGPEPGPEAVDGGDATGSSGDATAAADAGDAPGGGRAVGRRADGCSGGPLPAHGTGLDALAVAAAILGAGRIARRGRAAERRRGHDFGGGRG